MLKWLDMHAGCLIDIPGHEYTNTLTKEAIYEGHRINFSSRLPGTREKNGHTIPFPFWSFQHQDTGDSSVWFLREHSDLFAIYSGKSVQTFPTNNALTKIELGVSVTSFEISSLVPREQSFRRHLEPSPGDTVFALIFVFEWRSLPSFYGRHSLWFWAAVSHLKT